MHAKTHKRVRDNMSSQHVTTPQQKREQEEKSDIEQEKKRNDAKTHLRTSWESRDVITHTRSMKDNKRPLHRRTHKELEVPKTMPGPAEHF